jgi:hypothetical protein
MATDADEVGRALTWVEFVLSPAPFNALTGHMGMLIFKVLLFIVTIKHLKVCAF